ncbi:unnamed protein product [Prorocentrum cordatum]|uniref:Uncharacterized protein n=1 Tax=Prorocentrum cordatum TaxID=2364126 RepID=A0ABN9WAD7_9DINO|nr:unnamed protein product [Polarella glacialis]
MGLEMVWGVGDAGGVAEGPRGGAAEGPLPGGGMAPARPASAQDPRRTAELKAERLAAQISRLHSDVVGALPPAARAVWGELHALFQEKVKSEQLTEEEESEIERFVFDRLPTEKMQSDLILKVYKVLHLERERDCLLGIAAAA